MYVRNKNIYILCMSFLDLFYLLLINTLHLRYVMDRIYVNYGYEEITTFWHLTSCIIDYRILQRVKMATI